MPDAPSRSLSAAYPSNSRRHTRAPNSSSTCQRQIESSGFYSSRKFRLSCAFDPSVNALVADAQGGRQPSCGGRAEGPASGALVRVLNVLRGAGGELRLCELPPGFLRSSRGALGQPINRTKIVWVHLTGCSGVRLRALLKRSGYEVFMTRALEEAVILVYSKLPPLVICGPRVLTLPAGAAAVERFRNSKPIIPVPVLHPDFSTAEADKLRSISSIRCGLCSKTKKRSAVLPQSDRFRNAGRSGVISFLGPDVSAGFRSTRSSI